MRIQIQADGKTILNITDAELLFQLAMLGGGGYVPSPGTILNTTATADAGSLSDTFVAPDIED
ncbi:MAG: hypothetical protein KGJ19_04010 [Betaproteobacteria bacterium]|nr:hypothetical protein [Betaproteobacteria bacterium]